MDCIILPQNQLVMRKTHSNILWPLTYITWACKKSNCGLPNNSSLTVTLPWLESMTLALIPFVEPWAMSFHLKINWWQERHTQIFYGLQHNTIRAFFRVVVGSQIVIPSPQHKYILVYYEFSINYSRIK